MENKFWINDWARFRRDEVVRVPKAYPIHSDFTLHANETEIRSAFSQINSLFTDVYGNIAESPDAFGMPLREKEKFRRFSGEWNDSGQAPYRPFILLHNLFTCGYIHDNVINVPIDKYKSIIPPPKHVTGFSQRILKPHLLFSKLSEYGFVFEGLKNNKVADNDIIISYPDNAALLRLFKMLADKSNNTNRLGDFLCCSFRLLQDDMHTIDYGYVEDLVDKVHTDAEKDFVYQMDEMLNSMGLYSKAYGGYEGPGLAYYRSEKVMESKGPYSFRMVSRSPDICDLGAEKMRLGLRIRNVSNCLGYLETCPDSVRRIFTDKNDNGCKKRADKSCKHGISYEIDEKAYWRCACCHTAFNVKPKIEDLPHYIELVELGEKK